MSNIDRSIVASMIYNIYKNNGDGIGYSEGKPNETNLKACCECIKEGLKTVFVPEGVKVETVVQSELEASTSKAKITSKPKNSKSKAMTNYDCNTSKFKILKRSEPVPQSLLKPEFVILKSKSQKNKTIMASGKSELKGFIPEVLINQKLSKPHLKVQEVKSKTSSRNVNTAF